MYEKKGSLFCFVVMGCLRSFSLVSLESSRWGGVCVLGLWFHDVWTCGAKVLEYWMNDFFTKKFNKLNCSWKFRRNWNVPLVLLERSWWARFNGISLVRFGFRMCGRDWFLSDFCCWKFKQIPKKNQVLEGKISWGRGNTWANCKTQTSLYSE